MHTFEQAQAMRYYRQRFSEMPVGDPMNGAAYGEYLKSKALGAVIGVVAAVASVWTGGATLAAYAAAGSTVGIGAAISAGAMVAGGVMSGVGIVTGNKKLTKIGGVLSLAGGLGAMAFGTSAGPGLLGKEASSYGSLAGSSTEAQASFIDALSGTEAVTSKVAAPEVWQGALDVAPATAGTDVAANTYTSASSAFSPSEIQPIANLDKSVPDGTYNLNTDQVPMGDHVGVADSALSVDARTPQVAPAPASQTPATDAAKAGQVYGPPAPSKGILEQGSDLISGVGKFAKDNKELVDIGGKMLMGAMDPESELTGAKQALYEAQTTAVNATAKNTDTQTDALRQKTEAEAQQRKNANTQILMLDPRDPQYAQKKAEATAKGIPTMDMVTPAAERVQMANQDYTQSSNKWVPDRPAQTGILATSTQR